MEIIIRTNSRKRGGMFRLLAAGACAVPLALSAIGCSDEPTELNALTAALPLADLVVRDTVISPTSSSTTRQFVVMDGPLNLIGKTGNYTAITALTFYPSLFPARDTAQVYAATLKLRCVTWFGDSTGQLAFSVHKILRAWYETLVTWDTAQAGFYESATHGSFAAGAAPDTQVISIALDTAMVRQWLQTPASTDTRYGIVLAPDLACSIVRAFTAFANDSTQFQPQLQIIAGSPTGPSRDTTVFTQGIDTFVGNIDNLNTNPQLLYLQSGVEYRGALAFDVGFIPRGAIINSATLTLQRDPATSRLTKFMSDTSFVGQATLSSAIPPLLDSQLSIGVRQPGTATTFVADVRRSVQIWLRGPNYGLTLRPSSSTDYSSLHLLTFYNERATTPSLRPTLKIVYSTPRQGLIR